MIPFSDIDKSLLKKVKYVLCDIDGTLTTNGKLTQKAYNALWKLHEAGFYVIPVTGRGAGWCFVAAAEWPVDALIGENGAFACYMEDGKKKVFLHPNTVKDAQKRLLPILQRALKEVPGCRCSHEQFSRLYDLAIDYAEEPPRLDAKEAEKIVSLCKEMGANAMRSSIHVNVWFGDYSKVDMAKLFLEEVLKVKNIKEEVIYFGDAPNDEPMFEFFPLCVGVANVKNYPDIKSLPAYITKSESGAGFYEGVEILTNSKG